MGMGEGGDFFGLLFTLLGYWFFFLLATDSSREGEWKMERSAQFLFFFFFFF